MIARFLKGAGVFAASTVIDRLKTMWLIIGVGGTLGAAWLLGNQLVASFTYIPAVATIEWAGYVCQAAMGDMEMSVCSEAETERRAAADSPLKYEFRVRFSFTDPAETERHTITGRLPMTGLPRDEAVKGAQFNLLYNPAEPRRTSLPFGSDYHAVLIGLIGIAMLGSYAAIFWMNGAAAKRRREKKLKRMTDDVMSRDRP